jgi:hypothetical protein
MLQRLSFRKGHGVVRVCQGFSLPASERFKYVSMNCRHQAPPSPVCTSERFLASRKRGAATAAAIAFARFVAGLSDKSLLLAGASHVQPKGFG